jgi:hypothetical protein
MSSFQSALDEEIRNDIRFELKILLVPVVGNKTEAQLAVEFIKMSELTDEQREQLMAMSKGRTVITRDRLVPVQHRDMLRPSDVVARVKGRIPFDFNLNHFADAWRRLGVRPVPKSEHPEMTDQRYCFYDAPHKDYVYTAAYVEKLVRELSSEDGFLQVTGKSPRVK